MDTYVKRNLPSATTRLFRREKRCGFTMTELLVAATLLVTAMSVFTPLAVRSGRLWQDARHYRLAVEELSNQLERLTALESTRRTAAMDELKASRHIRATLANPVLSAETLTDDDGTRLVLHLAWDRLGQSAPVTLVGWIDPLPSTTTSASEERAP